MAKLDAAMQEHESDSRVEEGEQLLLRSTMRSD